VIVDNDSEHSAEVVLQGARSRNHLKNLETSVIEVLRLPSNQGFAAAFNAGSQKLKEAGLVHWVNVSHDCVLAKPTLGALIQKAIEPMTLVGPTVLDAYTNEVFSAGGYVHPWSGKIDHLTGLVSQPTRVDWLDGSCFALSKDLFDKTGGMDERFFLYFEDVDFGLRVKATGGTVWVVSAVSYQDPQGPSSYLRGHSSGLLAKRHFDSALGWALIARNATGAASGIARGRWQEGVSRARGLAEGLKGKRAAY
jgi:GT2 family glycosyltransferase